MKHVQFLRHLRQLQFNGKLIRTDTTGQQWVFYFSQGAIVYATGGLHPYRRWFRQLTLHCPQQAPALEEWQYAFSDLKEMSAAELSLGWEYALLKHWIRHQEITPEQGSKLIRSILVEILVDIEQAGDLKDQILQDSLLSAPLGTLRLEELTAKAQTRWQTWQDSGLAAYSPHSAPVITQAEVLQQYTSASFYQTLCRLLNGQQTLLDLSVQMHRKVVEVTTSLLPFIQRSWIELVRIPDLPSPLTLSHILPSLSVSTKVRTALIACIDDSFLIRHLMDKLVSSAGYQFLGIDDPVRSIGILLARKPDLIFLDLMMPNASGHEICAQLRKLSHFQKTPIVILTGSDGFANRLRSNFVGASDFLSKPLNAEAVLNVIRKHLEPTSIVNTSIVDGG